MSRLRQLFHIESRTDLPAIRQFITAASAQLGADKEKTADLVVAAHELATNTFEHGFAEKPCEIQISVSMHDNVLFVELIDKGPYFDPTGAEKPDTNAPLETRGKGGMGILMASEFVDRMSYQRTAKEQNIITLEIGGHDGN